MESRSGVRKKRRNGEQEWSKEGNETWRAGWSKEEKEKWIAGKE